MSIGSGLTLWRRANVSSWLVRAAPAPGRGLDGGYRALQPGVIANALLQGVNAAGDHHQQVVEVVRDAAGKLPERVKLLRFGELTLHLLELELRVAPFGDVAGDLGKSDQPAVFADRVDDHASPEEGTILADAPAFFLIAALFSGDLQRAGGFAVATVGFGIKAGEMPTENFLGRITLDPLTANIPARDNAGGIEHVQRVVGDPFNQKTKTALALE